MREGSPRPARSSFPAASVPREDHVTAPTDSDVDLRLPYLSVGLPRSRSVCAFCQEATLRPGLLTSKPRTVQGRHRKGLRCCSCSPLVGPDPFPVLPPFAGQAASVSRSPACAVVSVTLCFHCRLGA